MRCRICSCQEKVGSEDVQRLGDVVISLKGKVGSLGQNLRQGAEHVGEVEGAMVSINKQMQTMKQAFSMPFQCFPTAFECCLAVARSSPICTARRAGC